MSTTRISDVNAIVTEPADAIESIGMKLSPQTNHHSTADTARALRMPQRVMEYYKRGDKVPRESSKSLCSLNFVATDSYFRLCSENHLNVCVRESD